MTRASLELEGVDDEGLDELDRKVLAAIISRYGGGPVGIEALAATLQEETDTLTDVVEPFLLQQGFLIRTSSGRRATARSYDHLGIERPRSVARRSAAARCYRPQRLRDRFGAAWAGRRVDVLVG